VETLTLERVSYRDLNSRQKENYNFQKLSAILADFGYVTLRLSDDWHGADFIAQHVDGRSFLRVQLKSRLTFRTAYLGKDLYIAFNDGKTWYLFPHDDVLTKALELTTVRNTTSWSVHGGYSFPGIPQSLRPILDPFRIPEAESPAVSG
jgi:hypothetical protein